MVLTNLIEDRSSEFLAEQGIAAAKTTERSSRAPRRSKKRLSGGVVSFPVLAPVKKIKEKVREKVDSGEIYVGEEVVQTSYTSYTTNKEIS